MARKLRLTRLTPNRRTGKAILTQWLQEVAMVLHKPAVAVTLFVLGIVFVIIASRQVKYVIEYLEMLGFNKLDENSVLSYFLAVIVFFFVWLDIVVIMKLKETGRYVMTSIYNRYNKFMEVLELSAAREKAKMYQKYGTRPS